MGEKAAPCSHTRNWLAKMSFCANAGWCFGTVHIVVWLTNKSSLQMQLMGLSFQWQSTHFLKLPQHEWFFLQGNCWSTDEKTHIFQCLLTKNDNCFKTFHCKHCHFRSSHLTADIEHLVAQLLQMKAANECSKKHPCFQMKVSSIELVSHWKSVTEHFKTALRKPSPIALSLCADVSLFLCTDLLQKVTKWFQKHPWHRGTFRKHPLCFWKSLWLKSVLDKKSLIVKNTPSQKSVPKWLQKHWLSDGPVDIWWHAQTFIDFSLSFDDECRHLQCRLSPTLCKMSWLHLLTWFVIWQNLISS